jgi:hypothetical protein
MADSLFDIFSNNQTAPASASEPVIQAAAAPPAAVEPPKIELDVAVAPAPVADPQVAVQPPAIDVAIAVAEKKDGDEVVKQDAVVAVSGTEQPIVEPPKADADVSMPLAVDAVVVQAKATTEAAAPKPKPKKKRAPPKSKSTSTKKTKASKKDKDKSSSTTKSKKDKTKKDHDKKSSSSKKDDKPSSPTPEGRNPPGYSMLKTESDKLDRIIAALARKKENRAASGKPVPSVCGMINNNLLKFFRHVRADFDDEFEEYI